MPLRSFGEAAIAYSTSARVTGAEKVIPISASCSTVRLVEGASDPFGSKAARRASSATMSAISCNFAIESTSPMSLPSIAEFKSDRVATLSPTLPRPSSSTSAVVRWLSPSLDPSAKSSSRLARATSSSNCSGVVVSAGPRSLSKAFRVARFALFTPSMPASRNVCRVGGLEESAS